MAGTPGGSTSCIITGESHAAVCPNDGLKVQAIQGFATVQKHVFVPAGTGASIRKLEPSAGAMNPVPNTYHGLLYTNIIPLSILRIINSPLRLSQLTLPLCPYPQFSSRLIQISAQHVRFTLTKRKNYPL